MEEEKEGEIESPNGGSTARGRLERALTLVNACYTNLFEQSPVMMHSIDEYWKLVGVNRKWLATLGYEAGDVLGRRSIDFLAEDSRAVAVSETFPLFWRTGSARSVGYQMVRKDGRVLDVLLDADLDTDATGTRRTLAALRESHGQTGWEYSAAILRALLGLARVRRAIEAMLAVDATASALTSWEHGDSPGQAVFGGQTELVADLLEAVEDASAGLHTLGSILAGSAYTTEGEDAKLVMLAENVVEFCGKLHWLTTAESAETP